VAAGYDVNLNIALKNSRKLIELRRELVKATDKIREFNKEAREQNKVLPASINSFNKQLLRARKLLDRAAVGTASFNRAARALVNVEKEHNNQLMAKEKLLNKLRLRQTIKAGGAVSAADFRGARTKATPINPGLEPTGFVAFSQAADKIAAGVKANVKQTTKTAQILSQQATRSNFEAISNQFGVPGGRIGPQQAPFFNRMGFGRNAKSTGPFAMPGGAAGRLKGGVGSALIGGGFPFLFGAGGLSAIMGGAAGAVGGALAPGGGFALSIAATAIAAQIEDAMKFRKELKLVNAQLQAVGNSSIFSRQEIKNFAKELNITKEEATQLVDSLVPRFTKQEADALIDVFGKDGVGRFDEIAGATDAPKLINEIVKARDIIGQRKTDELLADLKTKSNLEVQLKLTKQIAEVNRKNLLNTLEFNTKIDGKAFKKVIEEGDNLQNFIKQLDPNSELGKLFQHNNLQNLQKNIFYNYKSLKNLKHL